MTLTPEDLAAIRKRAEDAMNVKADSLSIMGKIEVLYERGELVRKIPRLLDALEDDVPAVRAAAIWALDEINPSRTGWTRRIDSDRAG